MTCVRLKLNTKFSLISSGKNLIDVCIMISVSNVYFWNGEFIGIEISRRFAQRTMSVS